VLIVGEKLQIALRGESREQRTQRLRAVYGGARLRSASEFRRARRAIWLLAAVWCTLVAADVLFVPSPWSLVGAAALLLMVPAVSGDLFKTYDDYVEEWQVGNEDRPQEENRAGPLERA
jgi:hypothetical protein